MWFYNTSQCCVSAKIWSADIFFPSRSPTPAWPMSATRWPRPKNWAQMNYWNKSSQTLPSQSSSRQKKRTLSDYSPLAWISFPLVFFFSITTQVRSDNLAPYVCVSRSCAKPRRINIYVKNIRFHHRTNVVWGIKHCLIKFCIAFYTLEIISIIWAIIKKHFMV